MRAHIPKYGIFQTHLPITNNCHFREPCLPKMHFRDPHIKKHFQYPIYKWHLRDHTYNIYPPPYTTSAKILTFSYKNDQNWSQCLKLGKELASIQEWPKFTPIQKWQNLTPYKRNIPHTKKKISPIQKWHFRKKTDTKNIIFKIPHTKIVFILSAFSAMIISMGTLVN